VALLEFLAMMTLSYLPDYILKYTGIEPSAVGGCEVGKNAKISLNFAKTTNFMESHSFRGPRGGREIAR